MNGPVISFDISKGNSHMQGFLEHGRPVSKPIIIEHNNDGFANILILRNKIKGETGVEPVAVYEFTGVYSNTLDRFLRSIKMKRYGISPLESAKIRKAMIRPTKNDSIDCRTIAEVYYLRETREPRNDDRTYVTLKEMGRFYHYLLSLKIVEKCRYHRCLDDLWPGFDEVMQSNSNISLEIVEHYKNPSLIKSEKEIKKFLMTKPRRGRITIDNLVKKILDYSKNHVSGADINSFRNTEIRLMSQRIQELTKETDSIMENMISIASQLKEFELLKSIPGIADITATRLIAEIGDINAYPSSSSIVAYAGLDPAILQSGQMTGEHLNITKKGNSHLRTILFVAVTNMIRVSTDNKITQFVNKKKNSGLHHKAAVIAGCSKLLRIIFSMLKHGTSYSKK